MSNDTLTGKTIGKYQITKKLGKGGMAEVYQGYQENLDRYVAIKMMHAFLINEEGFLARFQREARAMAALRHPNIVRVYDFDVYGEDSYYLVMEYINGGTLKEKLEQMAKDGVQMPLDDAVRICTEVAEALAYAHGRSMVHRDIKPANIMIDNDTGRAILTDFGIVKLVGTQSMAYTATGALIGTPAYMSPEQALGKPGDERVDIYALGVLLFQLVTNQLPFEADTPLAVVMKHVNEQPPLPMTFNPNIPLGLQEIILKALAKNPADRYQTAQEMSAALRQVNLSGEPAAGIVPATTPSSPTISASKQEETAGGATAVSSPTPSSVDTATAVPTPAPPKRPVWLYAVIGVVVLALVGTVLALNGAFAGAPEPTPAQNAALVNTETPTAGATAGAPNVQPTPIDPLDAARTVQAELALTREAAATATPTITATPSPTPTATPTVDVTAQFLSTCETAVTLVSVVRDGFSSNFVPLNSRFSLAWTLRNSGSCPWPAGLTWEYVEGHDFGVYETAVVATEEVPAGAEVNVVIRFNAIPAEDTYESTWQLMDVDGNPVGEPQTFEVIAFEPPTPTPRATATPTPQPTTAATDGQVTWIFTVGACDYPGGGPDWRCQVTITPYIEPNTITGQYTVFIFDRPGGGATEFRGAGPFTYFAIARRCANFNQGIRIVDDVTRTQVDAQLFIDPDNHFPGGCVDN